MTEGSAHILISRRCVNNCVFCTVADKREKRLFPTPAEIFDFISERAHAGVSHLVFSGLGEPTLDPNFESYLRAAGLQGFRNMTLFTNGYGLTLERARCFRDLGIAHVLLSVHGMREGHDANVQRAGSFGEAIEALDHYLDAGMAVTVNTVLTRLNLCEIPELRAVLSERPISRQILSFPEWSGNAPRFEAYMLTYAELCDAAPALIPEDDGRTLFENAPYCLVRRCGREMLGNHQVQILDGRGSHRFEQSARRKLLDICSRLVCPLRDRCPGFETRYLECRGYGDLERKAWEFLQSPDRERAVDQATRLEQRVRESEVRQLRGLAPALTPRGESARRFHRTPWEADARGLTRERKGEGAMTRFTKNMHVETPAGVLIEGESRISIRPRNREEIEAARDAYGERFHHLDLSADQLLDRGLVTAASALRARIHLKTEVFELINAMLENAKTMRSVFRLQPGGAMLRALNSLTSLGFAVHIDPTKTDTDTSHLMKAADFYLHNPLLRVPVEPFHGLLIALRAPRELSLWEIEDEKLGIDFFVGEDKKISLSRRFYEAGFCFGRLGDTLEALRESDLSKTVAEYRSRRMMPNDLCAKCEQLDVCAGFLRAVEPEADCAPWQDAMALLRQAARDAEKLIEGTR